MSLPVSPMVCRAAQSCLVTSVPYNKPIEQEIWMTFLDSRVSKNFEFQPKDNTQNNVRG